MKKLKIFSTFTGIGSPEMALRNIGADFEVVGISEVDKYAILAYDYIHCNTDEVVEIPTKEEMLKEFKDKNIAYNFSTGESEIPRSLEEIEKLYVSHIRSKNFGDIRNIDPESMPEFDMFLYTFPCKNISIQGNQCGFKKDCGSQSSLLWECDRIIGKLKPKYLMMENVKNIVGTSHIEDFNVWIDTLKNFGYSSYYKVLNASDFETAQNRERVIMISILGNSEFQFPDPRENTICVDDILEKDVDETYFYGDDVLKFIDKTKLCKPNQLTMVGNISDVLHSGYRVYSSKGLCSTLTSMNGGNRQPKVYIQDIDKVRKFTPLECWRAMGYSDTDFNCAKKAGLPNSKLYERAGRGIAVKMLEDVFKNLLLYIDNNNVFKKIKTETSSLDSWF